MSDPHKRYEVLEKDLVESLAMSCYLLSKEQSMRPWPDLPEEAKHVWREKARKLFLPIVEELRQNVVDNDGWLWELYQRQCAITEAKQDSLNTARRLRKTHMIDLGDDFKILAAVLPEEGSGLGAALRVSAYVISLQSKVAEMEAFVEQTVKLKEDLEESRMALAELTYAIETQVPHLPDRVIQAWNRVGRMAIPLPKGYEHGKRNGTGDRR